MNLNDDHRDNTGAFTQRQRYQEWYDRDQARITNCALNTEGEIGCDNEAYSTWEDMHKDVIWYDTAPCVVGPHIGDINSWDPNRGDDTDRSLYMGWYTNVDGSTP